MSNLAAYVVLFVLTIVAFALAFVETKYQLYLSSSELAGYWGIAFTAFIGLMIATHEMARQRIR